MNCTAYKCAVRYTRLPNHAQRHRTRSITVLAKNEQKQPSRDETPQDKRAAPAKPVASSKGGSSKPTVQGSSTPTESKKQPGLAVRSEVASKDRREAGSTSVPQPTPSLRQSSDTRNRSSDADWGPVEQDKDRVGTLVLPHVACYVWPRRQ